jgi:hypothetical protein
MRRLATAVETCHIVADKLFSHARDFALKVLNCLPVTCTRHSLRSMNTVWFKFEHARPLLHAILDFDFELVHPAHKHRGPDGLTKHASVP